ncbi:MAG: AAA-like domain-containing protein [Oscillospiraceae bacterium]|nr:AAA-like domain-containing protein [Oscillospiraceae bacterium]
MKRFNVTGNCIPEEDYMVDITGKIAEIRKLVDSRGYFTINRARQYGKTTTLAALKKALADEYIVASISFQGLGDESFASAGQFCPAFTGKLRRALRFSSAEPEYAGRWHDENVTTFEMLDRHITAMCEGRKVVLMIDEVDQASNHRVFLNFLGMLREKFIARRNGEDHTFHSVVLAGVYDIKNLKLKMMSEGTHTPTAAENKTYNSPWNIAANFEVDMSFCPAEIATMLAEYEADHHTGMDTAAISGEIHGYTGGYPFLVSRICQCIDEKLARDWTMEGVREAVKIMLAEKNTLFDDLFKNLENDRELYDYVYDLLILGSAKPYVIYDPIVETGVKYGFFKKAGNGSDRVAISNRIFELLMADYYIAKDLRSKKQFTGVSGRDIVSGGRFDMELCLRKFAGHYGEIYSENDAAFLERHGRLVFLSYLRPLINGGGFYHIESQFTDQRRMDVVVDYGREQFIIELKLWRGERYNDEAYEQLLGYMESKKAATGYLLTFDFRKGANKTRRAEWLDFGGKKIFDVVV